MESLTDKQLARFWSHVKVASNNNCWEWLGKKRPNGYGYFSLNGKRINSHRVAFFVYNGYIDNSLFVMHLCDNRSCNNPHHLKLGSHQDNVNDRETKGRGVKGCKREFLTVSEVVELKLMLQAGYSSLEIANKFNITKGHVQNIKANKNWQNVDISDLPPLEKVDNMRFIRADRGSKNFNSKLNENLVREIKEQLKEGQSCRSLAKKFNVSKSTINHIAQGLIWIHVEI